MAKRFTDTDKWKDSWFTDLEPLMKIFWVYLCDNCDHAGIWKVNFRIASSTIGEQIEREPTIIAMGDRIKILSVDKWMLSKFIPFQYPKGLNPGNSAHRGVLKLLEYNHIQTSPYLAPSKALASPCQGAKVMDMDKVQDMVMDMDKVDSSFPKKNLPLAEPEVILKKPSPLSFLFDQMPEVQKWLNEGSHDTHALLVKNFSHHILAEEVPKLFTWAQKKSVRAESWMHTRLLNIDTKLYGANKGKVIKSLATPDNPTGDPYKAELNEIRKRGEIA